MKPLDLLPPKLKSSEQRLARVASYFALAGLALFALSIFHPKPLTVIFSMSIGHMLGMLAVLLYLAAVLLDARHRPVSPPERSADVQPERKSE